MKIVLKREHIPGQNGQVPQEKITSLPIAEEIEGRPKEGAVKVC